MLLNLRLESLTTLQGWMLVLGVVCFLIWFVVLYGALTREDLDPATRFMWVFVLAVLNIFGVILYFMGAPKVKRQPAPPKDYSVEPTTCVECRTVIPAGATRCSKCGWSYEPAKPA